MAQNPITPPIHVPTDIAYTCHNTGVCCNVFESIPADPPAAHAISSLDHAALNHHAGNPPDTPITHSPDGTATFVTRKPCGSCAMLTHENLCAIHALATETAKPQACQDFPWRYVETPGGIYVGLSFVCPSVRGNHGQPLTKQENQIREKYNRANSVRETPAEIALNSRRDISWTDYLALESGLLDLLSANHEPLTTRIIACCILPGFIEQTLTMAESPTGIDTSIPEIIEALRNRNHELIFRIAKKKPARHQSPRPRRMFLGMMTSFANTLQRRENQGRFATTAGVFAHYARAAAGLGKVRLQPLHTPVSHQTLDNASLPQNGPAADLVTRYLKHCIERKDLVLHGDINRRLRMLAASASLISWYAAAFEVSNHPDNRTIVSRETAGNSIPSGEHWGEALSIVERLYGFHSTFFRFFERNKAFADIVDSFLLKPSFPYLLFK